LFIIACALFISSAASAQTGEVDSRQPATVKSNGAVRLETEPTIAPVTDEVRPRAVNPPAPRTKSSTPNLGNPFDQVLMAAMQSHVGAAYRFNRTGPDFFDCSGFVWRAFQDIGINFQRGPARSYWATMPAPPRDEQFTFGTLVFFSNLRHVGIVVDEKGFYHSARHGGVMYSPFNDYWLSRIDGFRRVSNDAAAMVNPKARVPKPTGPVAVEEVNVPR
jgi:cell wall-associated NlpC family hydrolase